MKAMLCTAFGPPENLVLTEVPSPKPAKDQVLISVKACGVNFPDALIIENKYQTKPLLPFAPGAEVAGTVKQVGEGVTHFNAGDAVVAITGWGGMVEEIVVTAAKCIAMPQGLDFVTASALLVAYGTAYHALKDRARIARGETLLVMGAAGGVGLAAVEIGHILGARVIAGVSSKEKLDLTKAHGADDGFIYPSGKLSRAQQKEMSDQIKILSGGNGADVVVDPVGGDYAEPAVRALNWDGRYLVIGFAAGDIPRLPLNLVLLKGANIVGVFWGGFVAYEPEKCSSNLADLAGWVSTGKIRPHISARFPLERAGEAIRMLADRKAQGKIVVTMD